MAASTCVLLAMLLWILFAAVQSAEWEDIHYDPNHPGKCTINPGLVLNPGVSIKDPTHECRKILCGLNGRVVYHSCGVSILSPPCRYGDYINPDLPYPDCCSRTLLCN
ncbi:uncharacterized protein LOC27207888 [Drosophila simulans]|uniref:Single domain-containing protein n=2 Tax=melanogaster subgroup TaxID=32351 RepID=A0A0J9QVJ0_DROSI|nr:uncharacterized protein LOC27207888 [Drosophila simulans]XP_033162889.1 uncharacterized protein LOC117142794 [Drosophila mauritiana]KMY88067.1 uncharacterized protein Dsimw501_GD28039 [Drosophila simulans]